MVLCGLCKIPYTRHRRFEPYLTFVFCFFFFCNKSFKLRSCFRYPFAKGDRLSLLQKASSWSHVICAITGQHRNLSSEYSNSSICLSKTEKTLCFRTWPEWLLSEFENFHSFSKFLHHTDYQSFWIVAIFSKYFPSNWFYILISAYVCIHSHFP